MQGKVIEWYDSEVNDQSSPMATVVNRLISEGYDIRTHETLTQGDIDRLRREPVDLIITEMVLPMEGLPPYQTGAFGGKIYDIDPRVPLEDHGGLALLEALCWSYNANIKTKKLVYTSVADIPISDRAIALVGEGNRLTKPMSENELAERIRLMLPPRE